MTNAINNEAHAEAAEAHAEAARLWWDVLARTEAKKATKQATKKAEAAAMHAKGLTMALVDAGWEPENGYTDTDSIRGIDEAAEAHEAAAEEHRLEAPIKARGMAGTLERYKPGYKPCTAYSGASSQNNGDALAEALEGKTPAEVLEWAEKLLGMPKGSLEERYAGLNPGQRRMNGGNLVRNAMKRGDLDAERILAS